MVQRPNFTNPMIYDPRPPGRYVNFDDAPGGPPVAPYRWPQDTLKVPNGYGMMSEVSELNTILNGREFFALNAKFTSVDYAVMQDQLITSPDDGDFWCTNISIASIATTGVPPTAGPWAPFLYLQVQDTITGKYLYGRSSTHNGIPLPLLFQNAFALPISGQPNITPGGAGSRTNWIQPYPFLRGGSIRLSLSSPPIAAQGVIYDIYISMVGWKEYSHAAT